MNAIWPWIGFMVFVLALLALDLGVLHRDDRPITVQHALWLSLGYLTLALIFAAGMFALDSIPAIFAITTDPFIVYTSNVFAILGLRALYFALAGIIHRFHYLKYGLSLVLVVIGIKMILNAWAGRPVIPTEIALLTTAVLIGGSVLFSMWKTRGMSPEEAAAEAQRWWVPGSPPKPRPPQDRQGSRPDD